MIEILKKRRSVRKYKKIEIEDEKIDLLVQAALLSPTSRNLQPWEFVAVTDRDILEKLSHSKEDGSGFLKNAPLGIVVTADPDKSDVWVEDASIASIIIQLTAESVGLSSCWIQIRKRMHNNSVTAEQYVRNILNIPENRDVESIIAVGYSDETARARTGKNLKYEKVSLNRYGEAFQGIDHG
ncbi:MAG TPA: NAD(P)H nitroreductase [Spirochaetes bacterium]|nr:NAD(P)H nitroreductase [Spirochaetota bacterium]